mgnify:CR=1 FL=1
MKRNRSQLARISKGAALAVGMLLPLPAWAQFSDLICDDTQRLEKQLSGPFGAERQAQGLRGPDALIAVWIVPRNGDWTIVQSYSNGTSCILAMGAHWEAFDPGPA